MLNRPQSPDAWQFANTGITKALGIMAFGNASDWKTKFKGLHFWNLNEICWTLYWDCVYIWKEFDSLDFPYYHKH